MLTLTLTVIFARVGPDAFRHDRNCTWARGGSLGRPHLALVKMAVTELPQPWQSIQCKSQIREFKQA